MKKVILGFLAVALFVGASIAVGVGGSSALGKTRPVSHQVQGETGQVSYVIDGDSFVLESGLKVKLTGIEAPQRAWPEKDRKGFPLADEAKEYLEQFIKNKTVGLYYGGKRRDRYDRATAQVWIHDENGEKTQWLQEVMIEEGYGRIYPWPGQDMDIDRLFRAERAARKARRGIWNNRRTKSFYKIRKPNPNPLAQYVDSLQLVEGIIVSTADVRGTVYLNFGSDYKTDFTVGIGKKRTKSFEKAGIDPVGLEGARVRVRGWVEMQNGPIIWVNDPRRLEILE